MLQNGMSVFSRITLPGFIPSVLDLTFWWFEEDRNLPSWDWLLTSLCIIEHHVDILESSKHHFHHRGILIKTLTISDQTTEHIPSWVSGLWTMFRISGSPSHSALFHWSVFLRLSIQLLIHSPLLHKLLYGSKELFTFQRPLSSYSSKLPRSSPTTRAEAEEGAVNEIFTGV